MLDQAEEGRIGALGVASSTHRIAGLAMDLGGGSTQLTWVVEENGVVTTSPRGSVSFPYGAAALKKRLEEARGKGKMAVRSVREEMIRNFQEAYAQLEIPQAMVDIAQRKGGFDLYLCGGGFRGWGYLLMKQSPVEPYPIPIINGFRASRDDFRDTVSVLDDLADSDVKIFGVSKRRALHLPSVAILVNVLMDALPVIKNVQFCQGGVREGFLFDRLPVEVREQDALLAATLPYAPPSPEAIRHLLLSAFPTSRSPLSSSQAPDSFSPTLIAALANLLFTHSHVPRETRSAAALHCTTTGIVASANSLTHTDRAILALILCERWAGDLAPIDQSLHGCLRQSVSAEEAWWCQYLGRVATLIGDVYPSGRVPETQWRIRLETEWDRGVKKKESHDILCLRVRCNPNDRASSRLSRDLLQERADRIEKSGRRKNWIREYGLRVAISIMQ
jgi:retrograde regulation protein 2